MLKLMFSVLNGLFFFFAICAQGLAQTNEQITLTTYYPSPQGSYVELRSRRIAVGDNYLSPAAFCWAPAACGNVIDANADLVVEGNVGIGTIVPTAELHVYRATGTPEIRTETPDVTGAADYHAKAGATEWGWGVTGANYGNPLIRDEFFITDQGAGPGGRTRFVIDNTGNVGIGTTTPQTMLHLKRANEIDMWMEGDSPDIKFISLGAAFDSWRVGVDDANGNFRLTTTQRNTGNPDIAILVDIFEFTPNGHLGLGTNSPGADTLDVRGRAYAEGGWQTTDADYAEWLEKEGDPVAGDIIGINLATGKARKYQVGDKYVGICSLNPGVVGNRMKETEEEMNKTHVLVGLLGQLDFDKDQVVVENRIVKTKDGKEIGVLLSNGKVLVGR